MQWKYQKEKKRGAEYLRFLDGEEKELVVSDWDFSKSPSGYFFKCFVTEENKQKVDKIWTVWDYESAQRLKKKLGVRATQPKALRLKMSLLEEEQTFEVI